ncbi:hypothetical protein AURDEDRAFT_163707 [Auricularia subglabra TFB-10046 SS5]|nr:hypothetical protein AURDEDRAFT_163707 [Auricularia subglabra TFB-10046 SS5]
MFVAAAILTAGPAARAFQGFHDFGCTDEPTLLGPCDGGCYSFAGFRGFKADAGPYPTEHCVEVFSVPGCDPEDAFRSVHANFCKNSRSLSSAPQPP